MDASLRRILRLKIRLYDPVDLDDMVETAAPSVDEPLEIDIADVLVRQDDLDYGFSATHQKEAQALLDQAASEALTIFFPDSPGLNDPLPRRRAKTRIS